MKSPNVPTTKELITTAMPMRILATKMYFFHPKYVAKPTPKGVPRLIAKKVNGKTNPVSSLVTSLPF